MAGQGWSPVTPDTVKLQGGLDLITPTLNLPPGICRAAQNFECSITGGYSRIVGYERFDGRPSPSNATYFTFALSGFNTLAIGNVMVGQTSGATATCCGLTQASSVANTAAYTQLTGIFQLGEVIKVGATVIGTVTSITPVVTDQATGAQFTANAADVYRANISAVPGSGNVLGVFRLNGVVYAWRNNVGGTAAAIYKSSGTGWVNVPTGWSLSFNTGTGLIVDGASVVGHTSGATGTVGRVVLESGTWGTNAAGRLILTATTGTFSAGEQLWVGGVNQALAVGAATAITIQPSGNYNFSLYNFGLGGTGVARLYGADGVNHGFEFDGTVYVPINTGMTLDAPVNVVAHKNSLFFSFGPSLQFSGLGLPYQWSVITGAGELAMPGAITNLLPQPGRQDTGALCIWTDENTYILYGSSATSFQLVPFNIGTGAIANTAQNMSDTYVLEMRGVLSLTTTLNYGNFEPNAITMHIRPFIQTHRTIVTSAILNREKAQYRVFFSDGSGLYCSFLNKQFVGVMPVMFPNPVMCVAEGSSSSSGETTFFGSTNGMVYQLDAGTSFDGANIQAYLTLVYNSQQSHRYLKRYRRASLEISGSTYTPLTIGYSFSYGSVNVAQPNNANYVAPFQIPFWDSFTWDAFVWDGQGLSPTEIQMVGTAENVAITIASNTNYTASYTINTATIHTSKRRMLRGTT